MSDRLRDKVIVTAAITGAVHTPTMSPYLPFTPEHIADECVRSYEAGAAVAHIHARNPENGQPSADPAVFAEIAASVKSRCNIVLCFTTGGGPGQTVEQRVATVSRFKPELASCNAGSLNFGLFPMRARYKEWRFPWEDGYLAYTEDHIFPNTFKSLREYLVKFAESDTKPELEVYDLGMINNIAFLLQAGQLKKPVYVQFVLGILGGAPATLDNLLFLQKTAREVVGDDLTWSVCVGGNVQFKLCTASLLMGGNVRVGLEDNLYLERGVVARSNAEQVEKIIRIGRELGREPATPDEARQILGLKGIDKVNY